MPNVLVSLSLILAAFSANVSVACPSAALKFHDVTVSSDGVITRKVTVIKKHSDSQNAESNPKYVSVVRDVLKIEKGDEIVLNAGLEFRDASAFIKLKLKEQDRDAKGVLSTTFEVRETMISSFSGVETKAQKAYLAKIVSNYIGNGTYAKGCGEVIKTEINVEPSLEEDGRY